MIVLEKPNSQPWFNYIIDQLVRAPHTWLSLSISVLKSSYQFSSFRLDFFFFFLMQSNPRRRTNKMQLLWISKDHCITKEKGKLIKWEGGSVGVCAGFWRFEDYKCWERWEPGESSSSLKPWEQIYWRMKWSGTFVI